MSNKQVCFVVLSLFMVLLMTGCGQKSQAESFFKEGNYEAARELYSELQMDEKVAECTYQIAQNYLDAKQYESAISELEKIPDYEDGLELLKEVKYEYGISLYEQGEFEEAISQFEEVSDYKEASDYMKKVRYDYGIALYDGAKFKKAMEQFEKTSGYEKTSKYVNKCRLGLKYAKFDYDNFHASDIEDTSKMSRKEMIAYVEKALKPMYRKWYYYDENAEKEKKLVIDKYNIGGKEYGVSLYSSPGHYTEFEIYYMDDKRTKYSVSFAQDTSFIDVTDDTLYSMSIGEQSYLSYDSMTAEKYDHLQEEAEEAMQPKYTKEEVYEQAQQDVKDKVYNKLTAENIFGAVGFAASYRWIFDPVDSIQYDYDSSTKTHTLIFNVSLSEYGLSVKDTARMEAQYMENDAGELVQTALYSLDG